jgi:hypothetical protein
MVLSHELENTTVTNENGLEKYLLEFVAHYPGEDYETLHQFIANNVASETFAKLHELEKNGELTICDSGQVYLK